MHVVGPLLSLGVLFGAALWAAGAVALPLLVRGRNAALDVVAATVWSAALAVAAPLLDAGAQGHAVQASPRGAIARRCARRRARRRGPRSARPGLT